MLHLETRLAQCRGPRGRRAGAALRGAGVSLLFRLWNSRPGVLRGPRPRKRGYDFLIASSCQPGPVSLMQCPAHGGDGGASDRSRVAAAAGAPMRLGHARALGARRASSRRPSSTASAPPSMRIRTFTLASSTVCSTPLPRVVSFPVPGVGPTPTPLPTRRRRCAGGRCASSFAVGCAAGR